MLALGHGANEPTDEERRFTAYARSHGLRYVPPGNPADADLDGIEPGEIVAVRGLGLAFVDVLSLLTEGRGGKFVNSPRGPAVPSRPDRSRCCTPGPGAGCRTTRAGRTRRDRRAATNRCS